MHEITSHVIYCVKMCLSECILDAAPWRMHAAVWRYKSRSHRTCAPLVPHCCLSSKYQQPRAISILASTCLHLQLGTSRISMCVSWLLRLPLFCQRLIMLLHSRNATLVHFVGLLSIDGLQSRRRQGTPGRNTETSPASCSWSSLCALNSFLIPT